jgi:rhodanese-related sulfurtransferase
MQQVIEFASNHLILSVAWVVLFVLIIYSYISGAFSPIKALSTHDATLKINKEDAVIVDVRDTKAFNSGHILDAKQLKPEAIRNKQFASLEKYKDKPIIVVCAMGNVSRSTATELHKQGFAHVNILQGGMSSWESAGLPLSKS